MTLTRALQSLGLLAFGLLLVGLVLRHVGTESVAAQLRGADRALLGYAALIFFTQFFTMGFRWWLAMRMLGHSPRLIPIFRANAGSNFINFFAPGHFGEPAMAWWLAKGDEAPPAALLATAAVSALKIGLQIGFVVLLYAAFDQRLTVAGSTFLVTVDVLQNILSIWIPANMGVQEAVLTAAAAGGLAIDPAVAASATVTHKLILIVHVALGGLAFVALGVVDRRRRA